MQVAITNITQVDHSKSDATVVVFVTATCVNVKTWTTRRTACRRAIRG